MSFKGLAKGFYDMFPHSPTPWGAWDKHAHLYDTDDKGIGSFGDEPNSKNAVALSNRNRAAECVNALAGVYEVHEFMRVVRAVAEGHEAPGVLRKMLPPQD